MKNKEEIFLSFNCISKSINNDKKISILKEISDYICERNKIEEQNILNKRKEKEDFIQKFSFNSKQKIIVKK